jgi:OOP family OmpA-OmpF porin
MMKNILLTSMLCASSLLAASNYSSDYSYEVTPFVSGILTDSKAGLEDDNYFNGGISLGKNINESFIDQIEIVYMRSDSIEYENLNGNTNVNRAFVNAVKRFAITDRFAAYGLAGLGYQNVTQELGNFEDSPIFNYGLGLRYDIPYYGIAVKGDIRHLITTKDTQNDFMYTLGLAMPLGKKNSDLVAAKIPIVVQEIPEEAIDGDDDKDGVLNSKDLCPNTLAGVKVDKDGCEVKNDDDKDGVLNKFDKCPNTSAGVKVNKDGCVDVINLNINFDNNSAVIKNEYKKNLETFANILKQNKSLTAVIEAHTDDKGSDAYNQNLSDRRAVSVINALKALDINTSRLKSIGYGESQPIATNDTEAGKAINRRVTALVNQ